MGKSVETCNRSMEYNGRWIRLKEFKDNYYHIKCSECDQYWSINGCTIKCCFNCDARMEVQK